MMALIKTVVWSGVTVLASALLYKTWETLQFVPAGYAAPVVVVLLTSVLLACLVMAGLTIIRLAKAHDQMDGGDYGKK